LKARLIDGVGQFDLQILHVQFRAEEDGAALVNAGWLDVQNTFLARGGQAASLKIAKAVQIRFEGGARVVQ